ncbi:hypothetical protein B0I37DRAFT_352426 [Chaetomium sp. MPI-CAGE-AT-0009]|nr:hypothetical protein B0I37DRAFT_352426 [Chaetomium sp. MPI-CAGE-AT-0009]
MAIHVRRFSSQWAWLCLMMASMASAIPLSKFQPITATTISLGCILAYNAEIPGCSINDFVAGNTCSASCVRGLKRVESTLESACDRAEVSDLSVLGQALLGNLVELLCPVRPSSTTTAAVTETEEPETSTSTSSVSPTEPPRTQIQTVPQSSPPTSSSSSSTSAPEPSEEASGGRRGGGGGSPFDPVRSGSGQVTVCRVQAILVGLGMGLLFLR